MCPKSGLMGISHRHDRRHRNRKNPDSMGHRIFRATCTVGANSHDRFLDRDCMRGHLFPVLASGLFFQRRIVVADVPTWEITATWRSYRGRT